MSKKEELRTTSIENFLKAIYRLQKEHRPVRTSQIAEALNITPPSAHDFIKRSTEAGLVAYKSHQGVWLTPEGERIALQVLRNHRLLELYLVEKLGYSWDEVHEEAEQLEHHISEKLASRIASALGNPTVDPHGDPIPAPDGTILDQGLVKLEDLPIGVRARVSRLLDQSAENLRNLTEKGLILGAGLLVTAREPYDGLTHLEVEGQEQVIGATTAHYMMVKPE